MYLNYVSGASYTDIYKRMMNAVKGGRNYTSSNNSIANKEMLTQEEVLMQYPIFNNASTLYNARRYKGLPSIKTGKHRYYLKSDIELWILNNKESNTGSTKVINEGVFLNA